MSLKERFVLYLSENKKKVASPQLNKYNKNSNFHRFKVFTRVIVLNMYVYVIQWLSFPNNETIYL